MRKKSILEIYDQKKRIFSLLDEILFKKYGYIDNHLKQTKQKVYDKVLFLTDCYIKNIIKAIGYPMTGKEKVNFKTYNLTSTQSELYKKRFLNL